MGRRSRNRTEDKIEAGAKAFIGVLILLALAGGGLAGFSERLQGLLSLTVLGVIAIAATAGIIFVIRKTNWSGPERPRQNAFHSVPRSAYSAADRPKAAAYPRTDRPKAADYSRANRPKTAAFVWTVGEVQKHLNEIDWYQFEKFCAAILEADGFEVERKGGASPDGGVDLVAQKNQTRTLIQCKHWKTWKIREPVIRQLLGSMVDFKVGKGGIFFSGESTEPAKEFAAKHGIGLVNGAALAAWALNALSSSKLDTILKCKEHHCPRCDSRMVWRTGDFKPFWGCSSFPKCRGVLKHSGAR